MSHSGLPAWVLMWGLSIAIFASLKWLTWWRARRLVGASMRRQLAYLLLWPGMDAVRFLDSERAARRPAVAEALVTSACLAGGAVLFWAAARLTYPKWPLAAGWIGLVGLALMLHFGAFRMLSMFWRFNGVDASPLMEAPVLARSLGEFWSKRWNTAFHVLARDFVVAPSRHTVGAAGAVMLAFLASGLVHDLVISVPARAGFGLPTAFFLLQGLALLFERGAIGHRLGLGSGLRGRVYALAIVAVPAFWLFHPAFVINVFLPFMHVGGAL